MDGTYPSTFSTLFPDGTGTNGQNGMNVEYRRLQAASGYRDGGGGGAGARGDTPDATWNPIKNGI